VGAVVTCSAVSHFSRYNEKQIEQWRNQGYYEVINQRTGQVMRLGLELLEDIEANHDGRLSIERAVRSLDRPLLVIHGEDDESVPSAEAREIISWSDPDRSELLLLKGTGHTFGAVHPYAGKTAAFETVLNRTSAFLSKHLVASSD
jgi:pimeloyl-ACP methyl ester carboxylesterase